MKQDNAFCRDQNGCLTNDGYRVYSWTEENMLSAIETTAAATNVGIPKRRSEYVFDGLGRRVESRYYSGWNGSTYSTTNVTRFVWDGFNVLATLDADNSVKSYVVHGLDLSQSLQGAHSAGSGPSAGGIGGILAAIDEGTNRLYTADGNGNITHVLDEQGAVVAEYKYGPFGRQVESSGTFADDNRWRFSSQWYEPFWNHYRYVYRIYLPDIGIWGSRDPDGEVWGPLVVCYVSNRPLDYVDSFGRAPQSPSDFDSWLDQLVKNSDFDVPGCCYAEDIKEAIRTDRELREAVQRLRGAQKRGRTCLGLIRCIAKCPHAHCPICAPTYKGEYWLEGREGSSGTIYVCTSTSDGKVDLVQLLKHEIQHAFQCGAKDTRCDFPNKYPSEEQCWNALEAEVESHICADKGKGGWCDADWIRKTRNFGACVTTLWDNLTQDKHAGCPDCRHVIAHHRIREKNWPPNALDRILARCFRFEEDRSPR